MESAVYASLSVVKLCTLPCESKIRRPNWWQKHCSVPIQVEKSVHREEAHTKGCRETHTKGRKEVRPKSGKEADGCSART